ncbi:hypothetical protein CKA32_000513 [Geitlerinema sp. FC II]|nr:hypothetical protein CKA32_000513 [Geitlerinema sp. FC II]
MPFELDWTRHFTRGTLVRLVSEFYRFRFSNRQLERRSPSAHPVNYPIQKFSPSLE